MISDSLTGGGVCDWDDIPEGQERRHTGLSAVYRSNHGVHLEHLNTHITHLLSAAYRTSTSQSPITNMSDQNQQQQPKGM